MAPTELILQPCSELTIFNALTVDKNAVYSVAINELNKDKTLKAEAESRRNKYLNKMIE
jgi:transposase-like protein